MRKLVLQNRKEQTAALQSGEMKRHKHNKVKKVSSGFGFFFLLFTAGLGRGFAVAAPANIKATEHY